jgi:hypothetical protein
MSTMQEEILKRGDSNPALTFFRGPLNKGETANNMN